jgi:replicative DNA helicase
MSEYVKSMMAQGKTYDEITPIILETYSELLRKLALEEKPKVNKTNIPGLDTLIGGFQEGRLYVLSAMTKQGKTTMAQTMMHNMGKIRIKSMIFSYEMSWREVATIFGEMDKVDNVKTELPVYVPTELHRGGGDLQFQWLYEAMAKAKEEKGVSFAVIDHLHFLLPLKDFQNTSFIIGGIVRELKRIATALQMSIMLIAHTQKIQDDKVPDWTMIRDSSFITQEADMVMMMYRIKSKEAAKKQTDESTESIYLNKTILSVELNRMGGQTGKVKMRHNGAKFVEMTDLDDFISPLIK